MENNQIVLRALVVTKGLADQLMVDYEDNESNHTVVLICYTLFGLLITVLAGLQTAFNYSEKAAGLRILAAQTRTNIRRNMSSHTFSYHNEEFKEAMGGLEKIIIDQNKQLAALGIDLASKVKIDYSIPSYFGQ